MHPNKSDMYVFSLLMQDLTGDALQFRRQEVWLPHIKELDTLRNPLL